MLFQKRFDNERGSALLIVIALTFMLTLAAIMSADRATNDVNISFNQVNREKAFYTAQAGIEHAVSILNDSVSWRGGLVDIPIGEGHYTVAVIDSSTQPALGDTVILRSTSESLDAYSNVEAVVVPVRDTPFKFALFSEMWLRMYGDMCTDSYDSEVGSYDSTVMDSGATIGTNGEMTLRDSTHIGGSIVVGDSGTVNIDDGVTLAGTLDTGVVSTKQDTVTDAEFAYAMANTSAPAGLSGSYQYSGYDLQLSMNDTVVLSDGVYYFNQIELQNNASLQIAPGAHVEMYVKSHIQMDDNTSMNPGGKPTDMIIWAGNAGRLRINDYGEFRGAYWGVGATLRARHSSELFGSINVERQTFDLGVPGQPCFHYDRALSRYETEEILGMKIIAWHEL